MSCLLMFIFQVLMKQNPLLNNFKVSLNSTYNAKWNNPYIATYNRHYYKSSFGSFGSSSPLSTCNTTVSQNNPCC